MTKIAIEDIFAALDDAVERDKIVVAALRWYRAKSWTEGHAEEVSRRAHLGWAIQTYLGERFGSASAAIEYLESLDE